MEIVVILLIAGAILLALETVLPGLVAGFVGFACLVTAVVIGYTRFGAQTGNLLLFIVLAGLVAGAALWIKYFPDSRFGRMFVSQRVVGELGVERPDLVGHTGTAFTQLRPSGTALIQGRRVDVVSEGVLIPRGTPVKVVAVEGLRVVVRPLEDGPPGAPPTPQH
jgi:membrane-bound serine protease (ClpP class)